MYLTVTSLQGKEPNTQNIFSKHCYLFHVWQYSQKKNRGLEEPEYNIKKWLPGILPGCLSLAIILVALANQKKNQNLVLERFWKILGSSKLVVAAIGGEGRNLLGFVFV